MRVVLDENLPRPMKRFFAVDVSVSTVQERGISGTSNGELIALLEGTHDVFVTADRNLRYQQNRTGRILAIVELPTNRLRLLKLIAADIVTAVVTATPGSYTQVAMPTS